MRLSTKSAILVVFVSIPPDLRDKRTLVFHYFVIMYVQFVGICAYFIRRSAMNENNVLVKFRQQKIMTIGQLVQLIQCSAVTVRRRLKKWGTFTSINQNGRYYTLPQIPEFDSNGLWRYRSVLFSMYGNLKQTIIELIKSSPVGLSAVDIARIVEIPSNSSYFSQIRDADGIKREKHHGRFIYFSEVPTSYQQQKRAMDHQVTTDWPTDSQAINILVHFIKNPGIDVEQLAIETAPPGKRFDSDIIERFLQFHDLVKKTPDTPL